VHIYCTQNKFDSEELNATLLTKACLLKRRRRFKSAVEQKVILWKGCLFRSIVV